MYYAAAEGDIAEVRQLLCGSDLGDVEYALCGAAAGTRDKLYSPDALRLLLEHSGHLDAVNKDKALEWAVRAGNIEAVLLLLDAGADPAANGSRALEIAVDKFAKISGVLKSASLFIDIAALLVKRGANPFCSEALPLAAPKSVEMLRVLLDAAVGDSPSIRAPALSRALRASLLGEFVPYADPATVVPLLLAAGAVPDEALDMASEGGHDAVAELLLAAGAKVSKTALYTAVRAAPHAVGKWADHFVATVELLLAAGADADEACLVEAARAHNVAIVSRLLGALDKGAKPGLATSALAAAINGADKRCVRADVPDRIDDSDIAACVDARSWAGCGFEEVVAFMQMRNACARASARIAASCAYRATTQLLLDAGAKA